MAVINDVLPKLFLSARTDMQANPDHMGGHQPTIGTAHRFIHLGVHFFHSQAVTLDSADVAYHLILTPAHGPGHTECHLIGEVSMSLTTDFEFLEDVTGADPAVIPFNSRRASSNVAETRCGTALTGYTGGTALETHSVGAAGGSKSGGGVSRADEIILKPSTIYALKFTSLANSNRISSRFAWYEVGAETIGG